MKTSKFFWDGELPSAGYARLMVFGQTGAGKSTFGATMPGPRFIIAADANASVPLHRSLSDLPRVFTPEGETSRRPAGLVTVETFSDVMDAVSMLAVEGKKRGIQSIVVDSLTAVSELCIYETLDKRRGDKNESKLSMQDYGTLFVKLDGLRHHLHQLPMHILWLAGVKRVRTTDDPSAMRPEGPDLVGQSADRFPANCQASLYIERAYTNGKSVVRVRTGSDHEVIAKDNTGTLSQYEVPDAYVLLSKMGFLPPLSGSERARAVSAQESIKTPKVAGLTL